MISVVTSVIPAVCADDAPDCPSETKEAVVTVTPTSTAIHTNVISTKVVVTSVVPQKTLYYECSPSQKTSAQGMMSTSQAKETLDIQPSTSIEDESRVVSYTNVQQLSSSINSATLASQFAGIANKIQGSATVEVSTSSVSSVADTILFSYHAPTFSSSGQSGPPGNRPVSVATSLPMTTASHTSSASSTVESQRKDANPTPSSSNHAVVAGGIVGGILGIIVIACFVIWMKRKKNDKHENAERWNEKKKKMRMSITGRDDSGH